MIRQVKIKTLQKINATLVKELENRDKFINDIKDFMGADNFYAMKISIRNK
jgi:hypothetical protein